MGVGEAVGLGPAEVGCAAEAIAVIVAATMVCTAGEAGVAVGKLEKTWQAGRVRSKKTIRRVNFLRIVVKFTRKIGFLSSPFVS